MSASSPGAVGSATPLVSIVIPSCDYAEFLGEAIESALHQSHPGVEVIVVDDGSIDDSLAVAHRYVPRITVISQERRGLAGARNRGIAAASGSFVVSLDADDRLDPRYVERCLDTIARHPDAGYVYTSMRLFGARTSVWHSPAFSVAALKADSIVHAGALLRRDLVLEHPYEPVAWEDWDLYLTLAERGIYGVVVDEPLYEYRIHHDRVALHDIDNADGAANMRVLVAKHRALFTRREVVLSELRFAPQFGAVRALARPAWRLGRVLRRTVAPGVAA
jgi:glycosyltransferase involved in cell wall biosynthesis